MKYSKPAKKKTKYIFTKLPGTDRKAMLCPECGEKLMQEDVEQYSACPYCGKKLDVTSEMEDFILLPFFDLWDLNGNRIIPQFFIPEDDKLK